MTAQPTGTLPEIPVVDATSGRSVVRCLPNQTAALMASAKFQYTSFGLALGDIISRRWLTRNRNPYLDEIAQTAAEIGFPGVVLLNMCYDWACTTGTRPVEGGGHVLVRVLDWKLDGVGKNVCVIRHIGPAGRWINIGWPGFSGVITAVAPGRFTAAINQPPLPPCRLHNAIARVSPRAAFAADWLTSRRSVWRSRALPAAHLLRSVCDEAEDWDEAVRMLAETPISAPAIFTVAGVGRDEGCVIERTQNSAAIRRAETFVAAANHWAAIDAGGRARGQHSHLRQGQLEALLQSDIDPFALGWLQQPVLNVDTRVVVVADSASGRLVVQGWEANGASTALLDLAGNVAQHAQVM